jgi:hypothetical protein
MRYKMTVKDRVERWAWTALVAVLGAIPSLIAVALWLLIGPEGFWQKIVFIFVVGGSWLVLQIWGAIGAVAFLLALWE